MSVSILILSSIIISYVIYFYTWKVRKYPSGPIPLPFIGNLLQFPKDNFHEYIDDLSKIYGPCFTIWMPLPIIVLADYEHIKEAFVTQADVFTYRSHKPPETLMQPHENTGIIMSDGDVWRVQRRASLKILRDFGLGKNLMEEQVGRSINEMLEQLSEIPDKNNADIFWPIQLCVGNVINESLFGYHFSYKKPEKFQKFVKILDNHVKSMGLSVMMIAGFPFLRHFPIVGEHGYHKIKRNIDLYIDFIEKEVNQQVELFDEDSEPVNFVHAYMQQMKRDSDLDMKNLVACALDFWLAGMETTSNSMRWHIAYMLKYPEIQDKVRQEIRDVVGMSRRPTMSDKPKMIYTQAVIHEVQRHSNMLPFLASHCCIQETEIFGKHVPAGSRVMAQLFSVLKHDPIFEDSNKFNPDRYLQQNGETIDKNVLARTIPFSIGKRACVGEGLARMELFLIFTSMIQKYEFVATKDIDIKPVFGGVLTPPAYTCKLIPQV